MTTETTLFQCFWVDAVESKAPITKHLAEVELPVLEKRAHHFYRMSNRSGVGTTRRLRHYLGQSQTLKSAPDCQIAGSGSISHQCLTPSNYLENNQHGMPEQAERLPRRRLCHDDENLPHK